MEKKQSAGWRVTLAVGLLTHTFVWHGLFYEVMVREPRLEGTGPWKGEVWPMYIATLPNFVLPLGEFGLFALQRSIPLAILAMLLLRFASVLRGSDRQLPPDRD